MEDIAARHAAETLLAEHKANVRFKSFGLPDAPATIADANGVSRYLSAQS